MVDDLAARIITVPDPALVLLVGPAGAGKSTLARRCFSSDEVISSDELRRRLSGDEADQSVSGLAFRILHAHVGRRLAAGSLTVVDATNVEHQARRALVDIARAAGVPAVAVVLDVDLETCLEQNGRRPGRTVEREVIERQAASLRSSLGDAGLAVEGFAAVHRLATPAEIAAVSFERDVSHPR